MRTEIAPWVVELTEKIIGGPPFEIGDRVMHPDGHLVQIMSGSYWGRYGLSNFWSWRRVRGDGSLDWKVRQGYGWRPGKEPGVG